MEQARRRLPAKEKTIAEIDANDVRVKILGVVIDKDDSAMIIDDGSGKLEVVAENAPEIGKFVKCIIRIFPLMEGFEARLECYQDMNGFDLELYRRAKEAVKCVRA